MATDEKAGAFSNYSSNVKALEDMQSRLARVNSLEAKGVENQEKKNKILDSMLPKQEKYQQAVAKEGKDLARLLKIKEEVKGIDKELIRLQNEKLSTYTAASNKQEGVLAGRQEELKLAKQVIENRKQAAIINNANYQKALEAQEIDTARKTALEELKKFYREEQKQIAMKDDHNVKLLEAEKKRKESRDATEKFFGKAKKFWEDFKAIAQDPKVAWGAFAAAGVAAATEFGDTMRATGDTMGLSRDQSMEMAGELGVASISMGVLGIGAKELSESYAGLAAEMGGTAELTVDMAKDTAAMAKEFGLAGAEAGKLMALTMRIQDGNSETAKASLEHVGNLARGAGVPIGAVMKDVANSTEAMAKFGYDSVEALGKAAVEAAKMGSSLSQMEKTADALLDIDNARTKAMQLSVLLGRGISVDKAQQLAYEGKILEASKEMLKQVGGIAEWNKMDFYQKKETAALLNMSTGEMQKQIYLSEGLTETGEKQATGWAKNLGFAQDMGTYMKDNGVLLLTFINAMGSLKNIELSRVPIWIKEKAQWVWKTAKATAHWLARKAAWLAMAPIKMAMWAKDKAFTLWKHGAEAAHWVKERAQAIWRRVSGGGAATGTGPVTNAISNVAGPTDKLGSSMKKLPKKKGNIISRFFKSFRNINWSSIFKAVSAMVLMGVGLIAFVPGFKMFGDVPAMGILKGITGLLAMIMAMKIMGKATSSIIKGSLALLIMGVALIPAALAFKMIAGVPMAEMWNFAAVLTVLALAFAGIGFLPTIFIGALGLLMMAPAMILAAVAFQMAAGVPMETMIVFAAVLTGLGIAFAYLGVAAPFIIAGSYAMLLLSLSLVPFAFALKMIPKDIDMIQFATGSAALGVAGVSMLLGAPGFIAMSYGLLAFSAALLIIKPLLPVVEKLAQLGVVGNIGEAEGTAGGGGGGGKEENVVVNKLDELINLIKAGGKVEMDGKEVGRVVQMAIGPVGM
jgi:hypothetical protein